LKTISEVCSRLQRRYRGCHAARFYWTNFTTSALDLLTGLHVLVCFCLGGPADVLLFLT